MARRNTGASGREENTLCLYLRELRRIPLMDRAEEQECARRAAQGDAGARQRLIRANLRFVVLVAKRYRNRGLPLEDLIDEGNVGLIQAAERFDPDRGIHFVSYAVWWIRQAILKAVHDNSRLIRVPLSRAGELSRVEDLRNQGLMATGSEPKFAEIAAKLGVEASQLRELMDAAQSTLSLDHPLSDEGDSASSDAIPFGASLEDRSSPRPEEALVGRSLKEELDTALSTLSAREASVLRDRFGLADRKPISLFQIGRKHNLSKERIRQIEKRALGKIRASGVGRRLEVYAN
jgi:RNA polymerase primary sigma factor